MSEELTMDQILDAAFRSVFGQKESPKATSTKRPPPRHYVDCAKRGLSMAETARELGITREAVRQVANRYPELKFANGNKKRWVRAAE